MAPPAYHVGQRVLHSCLLGSGERALYKATVEEVSASGRGVHKYTLTYDDAQDDGSSGIEGVPAKDIRRDETVPQGVQRQPAIAAHTPFAGGGEAPGGNMTERQREMGRKTALAARLAAAASASAAAASAAAAAAETKRKRDEDVRAAAAKRRQDPPRAEAAAGAAKRGREEAGAAAKGPCAKRAAGATAAAAAGEAREIPDFTSYFMDDGRIRLPMAHMEEGYEDQERVHHRVVDEQYAVADGEIKLIGVRGDLLGATYSANVVSAGLRSTPWSGVGTQVQFWADCACFGDESYGDDEADAIAERCTRQALDMTRGGNLRQLVARACEFDFGGNIDVSFRSFPSLCANDARAVVGTATTRATRDAYGMVTGNMGTAQFLLLVGKGAGYHLTPQGMFLPSSMAALEFGTRVFRGMPAAGQMTLQNMTAGQIIQLRQYLQALGPPGASGASRIPDRQQPPAAAAVAAGWKQLAEQKGRAEFAEGELAHLATQDLLKMVRAIKRRRDGNERGLKTWDKLGDRLRPKCISYLCDPTFQTDAEATKRRKLAKQAAAAAPKPAQPAAPQPAATAAAQPAAAAAQPAALAQPAAQPAAAAETLVQCCLRVASLTCGRRAVAGVPADVCGVCACQCVRLHGAHRRTRERAPSR